MKKEEVTIADLLSQDIQSSRQNAISYARFMEIVLYQKDGYYQSDQMKIGKSGDFYTSSSIHPVFAWVFADYFSSYCLEHDLPFNVCEIGGGNGAFSRHVLDYLKQSKPDRYNELSYSFIDLSEDHLEIAKKNLVEHTNVHYYESLSDFQMMHQAYEGIVFSNELIDAFPVHVVEKHEGILYEVMISMDEEQMLKEVLKPIDNNQLSRWYSWSGIDLPEGHRLEIPMKMMEWIKDIAELIKRGLLVTVDYGYTNEEWMDRALRKGSLRGYQKHQLIENPLSTPGDIDLTTHIHLDSLVKRGEEVGIHKRFMGKQRDFLLDHGLFDHLVEHDSRDPFSKESKLNRAIRSFVAPGGISDAFYVIAQEKSDD